MILAGMNLDADLQGNIAFFIGLAVFLMFHLPRVFKTRKIKRIIERGKLNQTYHNAVRVKEETRRDREERNNIHYATYKYTVNGKKKTYKFFSEEGYPPTYMPIYYDKDPNDAHPENEYIRRQGHFGYAVLLGVAAGVAFMFLTR